MKDVVVTYDALRTTLAPGAGDGISLPFRLGTAPETAPDGKQRAPRRPTSDDLL